MERLVLLLSQGEDAASEPGLDLYVVSRGEAAAAMGLALARRCRLVGLAVERDASGSAFGKQFKRADRSGARYAAVIGEQEVADGVVGLKDLRANGEQPNQRLTPEALLEALTEGLSGP
jgi:histidyl-tRNA synthetase